MFKRLRAGVVVLLLFTPFGSTHAQDEAATEVDWRAAAEAARQLPRDAFFGNRKVAQPRLSPDGSKIAFLFPNENQMVLGIFDRATKEARMVVEAQGESILSFFWKGNQRLIFVSDYQGNESFFVGSTDLSGRRVIRIVETQPFSDYVQGGFGGVADVLRFDPNRIMISGLIRPEGRSRGEERLIGVAGTVSKVNVRNRGISTLYTFNPSDRTRGIVADTSGEVRLRSRDEPTNDGIDRVWEHRRDNGASWREIARHSVRGYNEDWQPLFFDRGNEVFYLISYDEHDRGALHEYDTVTMTLSEPLFVPPEGEISGVIQSRDGHRIYGVSYDAAKTNYHWFEAGSARGRLQASIEAMFPELEVNFTSASDDERVYLVHIGSDREAGVYFVLDRDAGTFEQFERVREITPALMRPMEPVQFTARDGEEIHGYLTRPWTSESGRSVPMIVNPHGGPFGVRDNWRFNSEVQFLASRGYAVFQINYRGSGGYGIDFLEKGRHQWGRGMQHDLTDGVKWAIEQGIADPDRVAIYGASYGGYATLAGLVYTPELYACGVNYVGASDLEITYKSRGADAFIRDNDYKYRESWVGETQDFRAQWSPVNHVANIRVPTLHAYGRKDPRVEIDHWTRLESELKRHDKPYQAIVEGAQGHGFRNVDASLSFYDAIETFLAEHLEPERDLMPAE